MLPRKTMRVATVGGGHGQSTLLKALAGLDCEISAVVAVSDDGGCSGKLRQEIKMPPPGDLRRCLLAMADNRRLAEKLEIRYESGPKAGRSAGNQILANLWQQTGHLQQASDILARQLCCTGRAIPAGLVPCTISAQDTAGTRVVGETNIEHSGIVPHFLRTINAPRANPAAVAALRSADMIILGPGSLYTSVLAPLTLPDLAKAYAASPAKKILMINLTEEGKQTAGMTVSDYVDTIERHLRRDSRPVLDGVILDKSSVDSSCASLPPSIQLMIGNLRDQENPGIHCVEKTAMELSRWFGPPRPDFLQPIKPVSDERAVSF